MGVVTAFGSARKGLALAARAVADAVDRELVTGTSEQERRAAKALQRDTERAIARRALTYEKSKRTDLSFVDETNKKAVERQVTRSELVIGPARDPRSETFERDDGTTIEVADRTNDKRPNVWAPAYDADGRRVKPPSRGPKFDPPSHARVCVVDVLAARHLETRDAYITLDLTGERVGETSKSSVKAKGTTKKASEKQIRFDASFAFAAAKRLSDDERLVLTVRRAPRDDAIIGAVTIPVDAVEDANDPFVRDKKRDASHVRAFWTRLADPPPPPPPDVGTLRVACFADADAPGRIRVFVASARSEGDFGDDGDDEGRGATRDATRVRAGTCVPRLRRAFSSSPASYVRVSLNRVEPNRVAPKWDDRRRTATVRLGPDGVTYLFDESFTYEHVALDGDSSVSFELFREDALGGDGDAVAQMSLPVKHLPRARDGDAASKPRDRKFNTHSRSRRHVSRRNEKDGEKSTGLVCVAACFLDVERTRLRVRVLEAKNVRAGDKTGTSDPYVTATLLDGSKGLAKQVFRTKVVYGTTSPAWRHTFNFRVNENAARTGSVVLDLFDHDFGDFDADDFLGRVVLPLDAVATAGVSVDDEPSRRAEWYPWRDKARADPLNGEVLIRAYFPFESVASMDGDVFVRDTHDALLDPSLNANAAALRTRAANIAKREAKQKARRLELEKHGLRRELETQLRVQLEQHDWPQDLATRYARAYAKHAHETHKIPPPPLGLVVPASFAHMFETAERAAGVFKTSSSSFRSVDDKEETMTKHFGESAEEGLRDEKNASVAERVPEPERFFQTTGAPTDARSGAPSVPSWSVAAGGAASVYFQRSPTPRR